MALDYLDLRRDLQHHRNDTKAEHSSVWVDGVLHLVGYTGKVHTFSMLEIKNRSHAETISRIEARDRRLAAERANGRGGAGSISASALGLKPKKHILEKEKVRREKAGISTEIIGEDD